MVTWLKAKLIAGGAILLTIVAAIARFRVVKGQRDRAIEARDAFEAQVREQRKNEESDNRIDIEYDEIERQADEDLANGQMPDNIRRRNNY